jgi:hypothetical protein
MDSTDNNEMSWVSWMTPVDDEPTRESWLLSAVNSQIKCERELAICESCRYD